MFDIGFSEILLIFVLALVVLGPEKLPKVASQVGRWVGRARGMARQFREQLEEEVTLEESRRTRPSGARPAGPADTADGTTAHSAGVAAEPPGTVETSFAASHEASADATPAPMSGAPMTGAAMTDTAMTRAAMTEAAVTSTDSISPAMKAPERVYPPTYSHAHPTDSEGRPIPSRDGRQHDWVGDLQGNESAAAQGSAEPAYAPTHERGT
ncbi:MAG: twin-arginine translocase subunit TatB [Sinobacteraceae bacterium]|nr:twin-arginine translocase subunit TatB [Nevskiaceae bacterium]MBV9911391.1 twin-arginine translocase subunit TatB [Nevskiaceae bacterium]